MSYVQASGSHHQAPPNFLAFLSQAAEDDSFRADLEKNPQLALSRFGINVSLDEIPATVTLPSKQALKYELDDAAGSETRVVAWLGLLVAERESVV